MVRLIKSLIENEFGTEFKTYGVKINGKNFYDLSLDKQSVTDFKNRLNKTEGNVEQIDYLIEDFLSK